MDLGLTLYGKLATGSNSSVWKHSSKNSGATADQNSQKITRNPPKLEIPLKLSFRGILFRSLVECLIS